MSHISTYVIGDVQGCYDELRALLQLIRYDRRYDVLWFTGDLVNRGPKSLETLRFVRTLGDQGVSVLGNHDLHLIAVHAGISKLKKHDTFEQVLNAPDCDLLVDWLIRRPLLHRDIDHNAVLVHAGIAPGWSTTKAIACAEEVQTVLASEDRNALLAHMYGDEPAQWDDNLSGWARLRFIINAFTRMRYCDAQGRLELSFKGKPGEQPPGIMPWYKHPSRTSSQTRIIFGHWAALEGRSEQSNVEALDTGCVWGNCLTAYCLEDHKRYKIACRRQRV